MGYEAAPATRLLATHCAVCARPLVDANSVEMGIGPDCRRKHGFDDGPQENRAEANKVVHAVALAVSHQPHLVAGMVLAAVPTLQGLGYGKLAGVLQERTATVRIEAVEGGRVAVTTPYSQVVVEGMRRIQGRRWDGQRKVNTFPQEAKAQVYALLQQNFAGTLAVGPKGLFVIEAPKVAAVQPDYEPEPVEDEPQSFEARMEARHERVSTWVDKWMADGAAMMAQRGGWAARR